MTNVPDVSLATILSKGLSLAIQHKGGNSTATFTNEDSLRAIEIASLKEKIDLPHFLAEASLAAFRVASDRKTRNRREGLKFIIADRRPVADLQFAKDNDLAWSFDAATALKALEQTNLTLELAADVLSLNRINFYELLGTRNLGSFIGAVYAKCLENAMPEKLLVNGHQDGYPDLCALTSEGRKYIENIRAEGMWDAKKSWAKYPEGGIEIKTTCGAVPQPTKKRKKPGIGDERSQVVTGADWKAHHRETNNLLGLFWDFIDGVPTVIGLFYRNDLTVADWGKLIVPKNDDDVASDESVVAEVAEGVENVAEEITTSEVVETKKKKAGRTTSVSIMTPTSVKRMGRGWIVLPSDTHLLRTLAKPRLFDLGVDAVEPFTSSLPEELKKVLEASDEAKNSQSEVTEKTTKKPKKEKKTKPKKEKKKE